jgi:hypothetical protein
MSGERKHFQPANCRLKDSPSIDAEALRQVNLRMLPLTLLMKEVPGIDPTIECANCPTCVDGKPVTINFFMFSDTPNRICLETCCHKIPDEERSKGIGTFSEWPENSHFFGG